MDQIGSEHMDDGADRQWMSTRVHPQFGQLAPQQLKPQKHKVTKCHCRSATEH
eukprot:gene8570-1007_t